MKHQVSGARFNLGAALFISFITLAVVSALSLALGSRSVRLEEIIEGLFGDQARSMGAIVVRRRIPRTVFGLIAGGALGMSGALMQAVTRNPLADPGILGVNTGASLFVVVGIAFFGIASPTQYLAFALCGAMISAAFVYAVSAIGRGGVTPIKLALAGAATSAAFSSLISAVMLPRASSMESFRFWQVGGVGGATWPGIAAVAPFLAAGAGLGVYSAPSLNALALGDAVAASLGVRVGLMRCVGAVAGVLLCGAATALAGPIGFIGLMVPHSVRLLAGADQRRLIPLSAVGGAAILVFSDLIGRLLGAPGELEVGVVTAFLGAPVLIAIAARSKVRTM
jgi:iron complex transport system permease protein